MRPTSTKLQSTLLFLAWLLALGATLMGWASLDGGRSRTLDILTHFAPAPLAAALLALGLWWATGRRGRLLPALAVTALVPPLLLMGPEIAAGMRRPQPAPPGAEQIKVLQFNLFTRNTDVRATTDYILRTDPDIILLQEAQGNAVAIVKALAGHYPYSVSCYREYHCDPRILMKTPPLARSRENPGPKEKDADIGRVAWARTTTAAGTPYTAVTVHFGWPGPRGAQENNRRRFLRELATLPREGLIIAGDFNSTPWSFAMRRQDRAFAIPRRTRAVATWPAILPVLPIDHLYAAPEWRTVSVERGPRLGSDHRPTLTTLAYAP